jgi:hypothetical protein
MWVGRVRATLAAERANFGERLRKGGMVAESLAMLCCFTSAAHCESTDCVIPIFVRSSSRLAPLSAMSSLVLIVFGFLAVNLVGAFMFRFFERPTLAVLYRFGSIPMRRSIREPNTA